MPWKRRYFHRLPLERQQFSPRYQRKELSPLEWGIARAFADLLAIAVGKRKRIGRRQLMLAAVAKADRWRPRYMKQNGKISRFGEARATFYLQMPRMQQAIEDILSEKGLSLQRCAEIMASVAEGNHDATAADRLRAIDMRIKLTTGYAPTKQGILHAHANVDGFFDEKTFQETPPIEGSAE